MPAFDVTALPGYNASPGMTSGGNAIAQTPDFFQTALTGFNSSLTPDNPAYQLANFDSPTPFDAWSNQQRDAFAQSQGYQPSGALYGWQNKQIPYSEWAQNQGFKTANVGGYTGILGGQANGMQGLGVPTDSSGGWLANMGTKIASNPMTYLAPLVGAQGLDLFGGGGTTDWLSNLWGGGSDTANGFDALTMGGGSTPFSTNPSFEDLMGGGGHTGTAGSARQEQFINDFTNMTGRAPTPADIQYHMSQPVGGYTGVASSGFNLPSGGGSDSNTVLEGGSGPSPAGPTTSFLQQVQNLFSGGGISGNNASGMGMMQGAMGIGSGIFGLYNQNKQRKLAEMLAAQADPWGNSGGRADAARQLQQLNTDPTSAMASDPRFAAMVQASQRATAPMGQGSGAMAVAGAQAGGNWYSQRLQELAGLSGVNNGMGSAQIQLAGNDSANRLAGDALASIGYGVGRIGGGSGINPDIAAKIFQQYGVRV